MPLTAQLALPSVPKTEAAFAAVLACGYDSRDEEGAAEPGSRITDQRERRERGYAS